MVRLVCILEALAVDGVFQRVVVVGVAVKKTIVAIV